MCATLIVLVAVPTFKPCLMKLNTVLTIRVLLGSFSILLTNSFEFIDINKSCDLKEV